MKRVDDFRLRLSKHELVPIMIGGMGLIFRRRPGPRGRPVWAVGHISDAMINTVSDRRYETKHVKEKLALYKFATSSTKTSRRSSSTSAVSRRRRLHVKPPCARKRGDGLVFINCMEKLTMNAPKETLKVRMSAALDAGIDGITLAAGLHLGSFALIEDHPRFRDAKLGIIVSSVRALQLFLKERPYQPPARLHRGRRPLAGSHLGFGLDWAQYDLATIVAEVMQYLRDENLDIPVIPAGGIFTGSDAAGFLENGAGAVRVATVSRSPKSAACRLTSNRNTSRPARTISRSTRSRRPATRCA